VTSFAQEMERGIDWQLTPLSPPTSSYRNENGHYPSIPVPRPQLIYHPNFDLRHCSTRFDPFKLFSVPYPGNGSCLVSLRLARSSSCLLSAYRS